MTDATGTEKAFGAALTTVRTQWALWVLPLRIIASETAMLQPSIANEALRLAAGVGAERLVARLLFGFNADATSKDENGRTAIALAAARGCVASVELLAGESDLNDVRAAFTRFGEENVPACAERLARSERDARQRLHEAAGAGDVARVAELLARPAIELDEALHPRGEWDENSALLAAARSGHAACVQLLMPHCDPTATTPIPPDGSDPAGGYDALMLAAAAGSTECVVALLPWADPRRRTPLGSTALMVAVNAETIECVKLLLPCSDAGVANRDGWTALTLAAALGELECVKLLLPYSNPRATRADGSTALMIAAEVGAADCVKLLLPCSDADAMNRMDENALIAAAERGHLECVKLLLPHTNLRARGCLGQTPVTAAVHAGRADILEVLLPHCDARASTLMGELTALMYAAARGDADCVERLVPHSDARAVTKQGETALMWAARNGCVDCVAALLPASDAKMRNHDYVAAIGLAVQAGHAECADLLAPYSDRGDANTAFKTLGPQKMPRWLAQIESEALRRTVGECAGAATAAAGTDPNHTPKARGASKRL